MGVDGNGLALSPLPRQNLPMQTVLALSATQQAAYIRSGKLSSVELVQFHLDRIAEVNPALNAVVEVLAAPALADARAADTVLARGHDTGPLHGVPFSVKDSLEVAGTVCTAGTLGRRAAAVSIHDATLVSRLRAAGAIPIARTNLPDLLFAFETDNLLFGRTNNPYDLARTPGGSSGGEAALIAACGSPMGLGSDCAGSVRLPAAFCGIAGIKPTSGRLPRTGHFPPSGGWIEALWQIGPMSRRVEDLVLMMRLLAGGDGVDPTTADMAFAPLDEAGLQGLRVAFYTGNGLGEHQRRRGSRRPGRGRGAGRGSRQRKGRPAGLSRGSLRTGEETPRGRWRRFAPRLPVRDRFHARASPADRLVGQVGALPYRPRGFSRLLGRVGPLPGGNDLISGQVRCRAVPGL